MEKLFWQTEKRKIKDLIPFENNPRKISDSQREVLKNSLIKFNLVELPVINLDGKIVVGHQRLAVLNLLGRGDEEVEVRVPNRLLDKEEFEQYLLTSNRNSGDWDWKILNSFPQELLFLAGFDVGDIKKILGARDTKAEARKTLSERFIIPPFSILDTRQGYWQDRKRAWETLTTREEATRENVLYKIYVGYYKNKTKIEEFLGRKLSNEEFEAKYYDPEILNQGASSFDPFLTEIIYTWFNTPGGKILDPFAGGETRAIVASELKMKYAGVEIRKQQIENNEKTIAGYENIKYYLGDSENIDLIVKEKDFDLVFTCPPYYDLEVYSNEDLSAVGTYDEFLIKYENIFKKCVEKLKDNRFLVVVLGEVRNKKTGEFRNLVGDSIAIFKRLGLNYWNEMILINAIGSLPIRTAKKFNNSRKIGKTHQNILAFYNPGGL